MIGYECGPMDGHSLNDTLNISAEILAPLVLI